MEPEVRKCKWCNGKGYNRAEHLDPMHAKCPDCAATGRQVLCDGCGEWFAPGEVEDGKCEDCTFIDAHE